MIEREIDTAIDRAVRDFMDVDTDAAFRARVTARLQRPARSRMDAAAGGRRRRNGRDCRGPPLVPDATTGKDDGR